MQHVNGLRPEELDEILHEYRELDSWEGDPAEAIGRKEGLVERFGQWLELAGFSNHVEYAGDEALDDDEAAFASAHDELGELLEWTISMQDAAETQRKHYSRQRRRRNHKAKDGPAWRASAPRGRRWLERIIACKRRDRLALGQGIINQIRAEEAARQAAEPRGADDVSDMPNYDDLTDTFDSAAD